MKSLLNSAEKRILFFLLCFGNFTISFNVAALAAVIPSISLDLKVSDIIASRMVSYYMIPYGLGALLYAPLARIVSLRLILIVAMAVYSIASLLCVFTQNISSLFILQCVLGLSAASIVPLGLIIIGKTFDHNIRGRLVGSFFSASFIASLLGISLSGFAHWHWLFLIPAVLALSVVVHYSVFPSVLLKKLEGPAINYVSVLLQPKIRNVFIYIFLISLFFHSVNKWFGVYLSQVYSLDQRMISGFFILIAISSVVGQMVGGFLTDKKGRKAACYAGLFLLSGSTMLLVGKYPLVFVVLIFCFFSLGWTIGHNGISTVLTDFPDESRSEIASLNSSVRFLSGGIGFALSSMFIAFDFGLTFFVIGLLMFCSLFFLQKLFRNTFHQGGVHV